MKIELVEVCLWELSQLEVSCKDLVKQSLVEQIKCFGVWLSRLGYLKLVVKIELLRSQL